MSDCAADRRQESGELEEEEGGSRAGHGPCFGKPQSHTGEERFFPLKFVGNYCCVNKLLVVQRLTQLIVHPPRCSGLWCFDVNHWWSMASSRRRMWTMQWITSAEPSTAVSGWQETNKNAHPHARPVYARLLWASGSAMDPNAAERDKVVLWGDSDNEDPSPSADASSAASSAFSFRFTPKNTRPENNSLPCWKRRRSLCVKERNHYGRERFLFSLCREKKNVFEKNSFFFTDLIRHATSTETHFVIV